MNPTVQQSGSSVRLTYRNRTVVDAYLDDAGLLVVEYSDGVIDDTGINIIVPVVPILALTFSNGDHPVFLDGTYLRFAA